MIDEEEISKTVLLPAPTSIFYASSHCSSPQPLPHTVVLTDFFTINPPTYLPTIIGANGYLCAIATLFGRALRFRHDCERRSVLPFSAGAAAGRGSDLGLRMVGVERDIHEWFDRLPEQVKYFDRGGASGRGGVRLVGQVAATLVGRDLRLGDLFGRLSSGDNYSSWLGAWTWRWQARQGLRSVDGAGGAVAQEFGVGIASPGYLVVIGHGAPLGCVRREEDDR
ncbi:hypothetical protein BDK51DRAFT_52870 [Blyttiomyces helicus]|uniref:Uncharacterized protein n=1 Tax=Blyttiomyces helicus TaxID=388810 RepID=A0A4P9W2X8_9FUNG|nr:hypothetical protein BDK51DRAFT_52870 [Blyttiomyces helicus]|eukprot:RKO85168.1 hypothetical protein BDK51DRAFT_52870 [Blyttiomyces helicus]